MKRILIAFLLFTMAFVCSNSSYGRESKIPIDNVFSQSVSINQVVICDSIEQVSGIAIEQQISPLVAVNEQTVKNNLLEQPRDVGWQISPANYTIKTQNITAAKNLNYNSYHYIYDESESIRRPMRNT
jgi:LAS superfamily LD-carboxypeptidase LdcB